MNNLLEEDEDDELNKEKKDNDDKDDDINNVEENDEKISINDLPQSRIVYRNGNGTTRNETSI